jgi:hypothetical protein
MNEAFVGLIGGLNGAFLALAGSALADHRKARLDQRRWRREQLAAAYLGASRALSRVADAHAAIGPGVPPELGNSYVARAVYSAWLADATDARHHLHAYVGSCDESVDRKNLAIDLFDDAFEQSTRDRTADLEGIDVSHLRTAAREVLLILDETARAELWAPVRRLMR